jgi:hypothetical protein
MEKLTVRESIVEVVNKLFVYTDYRKWDQLQQEVFTDVVFLDMSSLGGTAEKTTAQAICEGWKQGFEGLDAVNHLAGNHLVTITDDEADVFVYATATHYKEAAAMEKTREFVGSYDLHLVNTNAGWRIDSFKYNLKYMTGNVDLK